MIDIFRSSPIAEKLYDENRLNSILEYFENHWNNAFWIPFLIIESPFAEKIINSDYFDRYIQDMISKINIDSADNIYYLLEFSKISDRILESGKLDMYFQNIGEKDFEFLSKLDVVKNRFKR